MLMTMVAAALFVDLLLGALGLIPDRPRPSREDIFGSVDFDYKLALNLLGLAIFTGFFALSRAGRRAARR